MTDKEIIEEIRKRLYETDAEGYPIRPHQKVASLQNFFTSNNI